MSEATKYDPVSPLTDLFGWFRSGWPAVAEWRREAAHMRRSEDLLEDDQVTVSDGVLTISAKRREQTSDTGCSEISLRARSCAGCPCRRLRGRRSWPRYDEVILEVAVPIAAERSNRARSRWPTGQAQT